MSSATGSRYLAAFFEDAHDFVEAAAAVRQRGCEIANAYAPYAVHGLDDALGIRPSRLPIACFLYGLAGFTGALLFQFWTTAVDWPINVGGKPWNSVLAFVPVIFELTVLCAGVGAAVTLLAVSRLFPGRDGGRGGEPIPSWRTTDDRFALVLLERHASADRAQVLELLRRHHMVDFKEGWYGETHEPPAVRAKVRVVPAATAATVAVALLLILLAALGSIPRDAGARNFEILPEMAYSPVHTSQTVPSAMEDGRIRFLPPDGTIPRGLMPLGYESGPEEAVRAGRELMNPFAAVGDTLLPQHEAWLARGEKVYADACKHCHGQRGEGDGLVVRRGYPPPPSLVAPTAPSRKMLDGEIFHIITFGKGNMPRHDAIVDRDDRWKAIMHLRKMQASSAPPAPADTAPAGGRP